MRFGAAVVAILLSGLAGTAFAQSAQGTDALEQRAVELFTAGKTAEAIRALEEVRASRRAAGEGALEARALLRLTLGYRGAGRNDDASRAAREAFRLAQANHDDADPQRQQAPSGDADRRRFGGQDRHSPSGH